MSKDLTTLVEMRSYKAMQNQYYLLHYQLHRKDRYLIWIMDENEEDRFFLDPHTHKIPIFSKIKSLKTYAKQHKIKIEPIKPILHDLDSAYGWMKHKKKDFDCDIILTAWNFFIDLANSFGLDNKELKAYCHRAPKAYKVYRKVFTGNNLPSITPKNRFYIPKWKKQELKLIQRVLAYGFKEFKKRKIKGSV